MAKPRTMYDKIWDDHLIEDDPAGASLIYIDRHIVHEVTSPQAFEGLRLAGRKVHAPDKTLLVVDQRLSMFGRRRRIHRRVRDQRPQSRAATDRWPGAAVQEPW